MKRIVLLCIAASLLTSCSSTFMVAADDMYGTVPTRTRVKQQDAAAAQAKLAKETESSYVYLESDTADGTNYLETFNYDDYYDYEYTSRLRRFHVDVYVSPSYYADYYTNNYWYSYDPYYFGSSIYLGYNWWTPYYYRPSWYYDWRWGWNYGWGYSYNPYYWGCGSYGSGYWDGYWAGRWDNYYWGCGGHHHYGHHGHHGGCWDWGYYDRPYDYCYNPYDHNTYNHADYGTRIGGGGSLTRPVVLGASTPSSGRAGADNDNGSNVTPLASDRITGSVRPSFARRYETAVSAAESGRTGTKTVNAAAPVNTAEKSLTGERLNIGGELLNSKPRNIEYTPSRQIEDVSYRLSKKEVNVRTAVGTTVEVRPAGTGNRVAEDNRAGTKTVTPTVPNQPVRNTQSVRDPQVHQSHTDIPVQNRTVHSPAPTQPHPAAPAPASGNAQPKQYSSPVYNSSRSTSSYTSPQYNRPATTTTAAPNRPATTTTPSRPATTATPSRPSNTPAPSRPASTSAPSRPASSAPSRPASSGSSVSRSSGSYSGGSSRSGGRR